MKSLPTLTTLAAGAVLLGSAASAEAQSCFSCYNDGNTGGMFCSGGYDLGACTTNWRTDPNTCQSVDYCANAYSCATSQDPGSSCTNNTCNPQQNLGNFYSYTDWMNNFMCYHYGTFCPAE